MTSRRYRLAKRNCKLSVDTARELFGDDKDLIEKVIDYSMDYLVSEYELTEQEQDGLADYAREIILKFKKL